MKLIILLAIVVWSNAAKLDRTYLPPSHAQTSGGSGNFLQTPISGSNGVVHNGNGFAQNGNGVARNGNGYATNGNEFAQNNHGFVRNGNGFARNNNGFAQNNNDFAQNNHGFVRNGNGFAQNGNSDEYGIHANGFEGRPERTQDTFERSAAILRQDNDNNGETYSYAYETENGIYAEENGVAVNGVESQGGYSYTGDDGQVYTIRYTADQNGFVPQGDHLPTPPPVPEEILRALEQNARDEAAGIYDDGSYNDDKYGSSDNNQHYSNNFGSYSNSNGARHNVNDEDSIVTNSAFFRSQQPQLRGQGFVNQDNYGNQGSIGSNQGQNSLNGSNGARAYLPPHARQNGAANGGNEFGSNNRQPGFNSRNRYQY